MSHKALTKRDLDEINFFRRTVGLNPIIRKDVFCIGCRRKFKSQDYPRQRMCNLCRQNTDDFLSANGKDLILME